MTELLLVFVALAAFLFGMVSFALVLYQRLFRRTMQGGPAYITLPGKHGPGTNVTYAITRAGWRRMTSKGPSKKHRRRAQRRLKQSLKGDRAVAVANMKRAKQPYPYARGTDPANQPVVEETE